MPESPFSQHLVFVDESGDHGLATLDPSYPMFVLAFCLFTKADYVERAGPALQRLKLQFWGHDEQVLHEHEIRKPNKHYSFLFDATKRASFLNAVSSYVAETPFQLVAAAIRKTEFSRQYAIPANPYELSLEFGLERLFRELQARNDATKVSHVVVECRGANEDAQLELAFRRICAGANALKQPLPFELVMIPKASNSTGLQLADLVARAIGIKVLRPTQANRAYEVVEKKFRRSPAGEIRGWGLKVFP